MYRRKNSWDGQLFSNIPILRAPESSSFDPLILLKNLIDEPFATRCQNLCCQARIEGGQIELIPGIFTILTINRRSYNSPEKLLSRVEFSSQSSDIHPGNLISLVCHRGGIDRGHYVSYHHIGDSWYLNDDDRDIVNVCDPFINRYDDSETVEVSIFKK